MNNAVRLPCAERIADPEGLMAQAPCDALWGVAKNTARKLAKMVVRTVLEFRQAHPTAIRKSLGVVGERLHRELKGKMKTE